MLRDFQIQLKSDLYAAWNAGARNVMMVSPTGSGKTVILGNILQELQQPGCAIAHRQELVAQLALALNRENVPHGIIAPRPILRQIIALEMDTHGYSRYSARAPMRVAGVDTLANHDTKDRWLSQVQMVVVDEGHHVLKTNKWGKAFAMFPNARGLFPTAHAVRADGAGLGRDASGLVDRLVVGPCGRELIRRGYLTDYRVIWPPNDINLSDVPIGPTGDYTNTKLRKAVHASRTIVGDVVKTYLQFAAGKLGITFAVDIDAAVEIAKGYRDAGIPAEIITAKTHISARGAFMRKFRKRELLQLVSVDVLGEGVDVPAIEVVSFARPTASWQLFCQQFGRGSRIMVSDALNAAWDQFTDAQRLAHIAASVKPKGIIIDHVSNIARHWMLRGMPDSSQSYSLANAERGQRKPPADAIPLRTCLNPTCLLPYERALPACPNCGQAPIIGRRATPAEVDGDLFELDPEVLRLMRGEIDRVDDAPRYPANATPEITGAIRRRHHDRQRAQHALREAIALWAGYQRHFNRSDAEIYKRFYFRFATDIATAQSLGTAEAGTLEAQIRAELSARNVVAA